MITGVGFNSSQKLAQGWKEHAETFELLINCAVKDPFVRDEGDSKYETNPRQTALEIIVQYFPNPPQTKDLLIDRINNDNDQKVRDFAQQALNEST
ncbi:MAG: hypothetical protein AAFV28_09530 [Cyanobacteria bacterium J06635_13]